MNTIEQILHYWPDNEFIKLDDLDEAIIGVDCNAEPFRLVYSTTMIIECLISQGMEHDDAVDHFEYNIQRSIPYIPNAPLIVHTLM